TAADAADIWAGLGVPDPAGVPMLDKDDFVSMADPLRERSDA
ncbi:MAG: biotin-independent malonate decarboxylase subunit beta, partial [Methylibium sp.]|nr:biotin-independent malonate decarboxylase subunit beta [Methylibium sp.]